MLWSSCMCQCTRSEQLGAGAPSHTATPPPRARRPPRATVAGKTYLMLPRTPTGACPKTNAELTNITSDAALRKRIQAVVPVPTARTTYPGVAATPNPLRASLAGPCIGRRCFMRIPVIPFTVSNVAVSVECGTAESGGWDSPARRAEGKPGRGPSAKRPSPPVLLICTCRGTSRGASWTRPPLTATQPAWVAR